jgi:gliding motility-associated-like protein
MLDIVRGILLSILLLSSFRIEATHLMGGEITWECQGNGRYIFSMKLYRDCNGVPLNLPVLIRVHNHPTVSSIAMNLISQIDISPKCNGSGPTISCSGADGNDAGAVEEFIFRSNAVNLPGTPPAQGWVFTFDDCCRNAAISNLVISPNASGFSLRAIMYPYRGANANPCFDSSPVFTQVPAVIICAGNAFTYNHNAYDPDKDSLVYDFGQPLDWLNGSNWSVNNPPPLPFQQTYSVESPFPGITLNGSTPASLNKFTGEIAFTPRYLGNFVTVVSVRSYRCGELISEIFREIQVVVLQCGVNNAPQITAPFVNTATGLQTAFTDTVFAGDLVDFSMTVNDPEFLPIGLPQTVRILASGGQFGNGFTDPDAGCKNPPCATLSPAPPVQVNNNDSIRFRWQTTCNHVAVENDCFVPSSTHTFVLVFQDDYCPAPAYRIATITVVVVAQPVIPPPSLRCTEVLPNGDVKLTWLPPPDPENRFNSYHVFSATSPAGPFALIDSIFDINTLSYTHSGAAANNGTRYYYLKTRSGCEGRVYSQASDTIRSMYLEVSEGGSGQIDLEWNPISQPSLPSTQLPYLVYKQIEQGTFIESGNSNNTSFADFMQGCLQNIFYYVQIPDASGCYSRSNIDGGPFSNDLPPLMPDADSVSVRYTDNGILLAWPPSPSPDTRAYVVYRYENNQVVATDTVYGASSTTINIAGLNPGQGPLSFRVAAIDSCNNLSIPGRQHSTIHLIYSLSSCENKVELDWTPYEGWSPESYQIWMNRDGQGYILQGTSTGNNTIFNVLNLIPDSRYCFLVRAIGPGGQKSSTSHEICFDADVQILPAFNYNRKATVLQDGQTFTLCHFDNTPDLAFYRIDRALNPGGAFAPRVQLAIPAGTQEISYTDPAVNTSGQSYAYRFVLIDKCGNESLVSNEGRTILLRGNALDGFINRLNWNSYGEWDAGLDRYRVYRSLDGGQQYNILTETGLDTLYMDILADVPDSQFRFCYYVEAIEAEINQYGFRDTSVSNRICLDQKSTIYIPNTFRPRNPSANNQFKAKGLYEKQALNHEFIIYNRWGEQIFYTTDPQKAWDGNYQSQVVPDGVYVYRLRFRLPDGSKFDQKGAVLVLD